MLAVLLRGAVSPSRMMSSSARLAAVHDEQHRFFKAQTYAQTQAAAESAKVVKIGFVGAGGINFGTPEGVWNHAVRLDKFPGIQVTAIVDPNTKLAQSRIDEYRAGANSSKWKGCRVFSDHHAMLNDAERPDAVFIGVPPEYHGSVSDSKATLELDLGQAGVHMFVEKPLSVKPPEEVQELSERLQQFHKENGLIVAVGYMLRYSPAIEAAKRLLRENDTPTAFVVGRYVSTYNHIVKHSWWDFALSGGTIVEQATHFVDLMRYLASSEIDEKSIQAVAVGPDYPLKQMPKEPLAETMVPMERRINRVTSANWRFKSGAVGSLNHSCIQHGSYYYTTLEVVADGLHILITDPYNKPSLQVRRSLSDEYELVPLDLDKDMYVHELETFIYAVRTGDQSDMRCPYHDCAVTYQASRWITDVANRNRPPGTW